MKQNEYCFGGEKESHNIPSEILNVVHVFVLFICSYALQPVCGNCIFSRGCLSFIKES